jgi:hypothetical protein
MNGLNLVNLNQNAMKQQANNTNQNTNMNSSLSTNQMTNPPSSTSNCHQNISSNCTGYHTLQQYYNPPSNPYRWYNIRGREQPLNPRFQLIEFNAPYEGVEDYSNGLNRSNYVSGCPCGCNSLCRCGMNCPCCHRGCGCGCKQSQ